MSKSLSLLLLTALSIWLADLETRHVFRVLQPIRSALSANSLAIGAEWTGRINAPHLVLRGQ